MGKESLVEAVSNIIINPLCSLMDYFFWFDTINLG